MKYVNLVKELQTAVTQRQGADIIKVMYKIQKLPIIIQYYLIKGFKLADKKTFYEMFTIERNYCIPIIKNILEQVYDYKKETNWESNDDYVVAFDGMGNIDAYVTAIKAL